MKLHVPALCLAGVLVVGGAAKVSADEHMRSSDKNRSSNSYSSSNDYRSNNRGYMMKNDEAYTRDGRYFVYAGEPLFYRTEMYTDLPTIREVGNKLSSLVDKQNMEIAHLTAFAGRSRQAGFQNIPTVYEHMAGDHMRLVSFASRWLTDHNRPVPTSSHTMNVADMAPAATIDHMYEMHVKSFNDSLSQLKTERSSTVRGALLMAAATTARHISLLRTLDRDVEFGRKNLSAFLQSQMDGTMFASNTELMTRIIEEERTILGLTTTTYAESTSPVYVEREREVIVERPVIVEREVERVVTQPAPTTQTERIVTQPMTTRTTRVAGQRQTTIRRRPAK